MIFVIRGWCGSFMIDDLGNFVNRKPQCDGHWGLFSSSSRYVMFHDVGHVTARFFRPRPPH